MPPKITSARFGAGAEGNGLPADELRIADDQHGGVVEMVLERPPSTLQEERVPGRENGFPGEFLGSALGGEHDEVTAVGDHPRKREVADKRRPRRNDHLGKAGAARHEPVVRREGVLLHQRARVAREILGDRARAPVREEPLAEEEHDGDRPRHDRQTREREGEVAEAPGPGIVVYSDAMTLTGEPVSASSDPARAPKASGSSKCEAGSSSRTAVTTITGRRAATAPLTLISAVTSATSTSIATSRRVRLPPARLIATGRPRTSFPSRRGSR
jgi:hypothetical protein